jgi:multiple sugar transport system substrate-binding protein
MPLDKKSYSDPAAVDKWVKNDVHPPEFKTAVVDYTLNHSVTAFGQTLKNMDNLNEVLTPALQEIQTGKRPAKAVLTEVVPKINERLQGWQPRQEV